MEKHVASKKTFAHDRIDTVLDPWLAAVVWCAGVAGAATVLTLRSTRVQRYSGSRNAGFNAGKDDGELRLLDSTLYDATRSFVAMSRVAR
jgi:hypothetical protein